jgi:serine/threonine protein kinase
MSCDCTFCLRFELRDAVIEGGFSKVHKALDRETDDFVAIKFINSSEDPFLAKSIWERESKALKSFNSSFIAKYIASGNAKCKSSFFLATEWLEESLQDRLSSKRFADGLVAWRDLANGLVRAIAISHNKNTFHRDLKPGNIMFRSSAVDDWSPVIIDFGAASAAVSDETQTVAEFHTPLFAPLDYHLADGLARDIYSIAAVLAVVLMRNQPKTRESLMDGFDELEGESLIGGHYHRVLAKALKPSSMSFFASIEQFRDEFLLATKNAVEESFKEQKQSIHFALKHSAIESLKSKLGNDYETASELFEDAISGEFWIAFSSDSISKAELSDFTLFFAGMEAQCTVNSKAGIRGPFEVRTIRHLSDSRFEISTSGLRELSSFFEPHLNHSKVSNSRHFYSSVELLRNLLSSQVKKQGEQKGPAIGVKDFIETAKSLVEVRKKLILDSVQEFEYELVEGDHSFFSVRVLGNIGEIPDGASWELKGKGLRSTYLVMDGHKDDLLDLKASRPIKDFPPKGRLSPSLGQNEVSFSRQLDALRELESGTAIFNKLPQILADANSGGEPVNVVEISNSGLDEPKVKALNAAARSPDIFVLEGPPGTGKTEFIVALISSHLERYPNDRILLASQTNVAVDNVLERLPPDLASGTVRVAKESLSSISPGAEEFVIEKRLMAWRTDVGGRAGSFLDNFLTSRDKVKVPIEKLNLLQKLQLLLSDLETVVERQRQSFTQLRAAIEDVNLDDLPADQQRLGADILNVRSKLKRLNPDMRLLSTTSSELVGQAIETLLHNNPELSRDRELLNVHAMWLARFGEDPALRETLIRKSVIVAGTCIGFVRDKTVRSLDFDLCIVDESSRATTNELLVPMSRARKVVLIGDTRQLPPNDEELLSRTDLLKSEGLNAKDVKKTIFNFLAESLPASKRALLTMQYRMSPEIGDLISTCFYGGELETAHPDVIPIVRSHLNPQVLWLDTASPNGISGESKTPSGSKRNLSEVEIIHNYLDRILKTQLSDLPELEKPVQVLVIAPYRAQVASLRKRLLNSIDFSGRAVIRVETLDAVQGLEADVAMLSVTRSNERGNLGFIGPDYWRRINVALSRARHKLIIVGDSSTIRAGHFEADSFGLHKVLDYMESHPNSCKVMKVSAQLRNSQREAVE